jgi:hypothetical protein
MTVGFRIPALTLAWILPLMAACGGIRHNLGASDQAPIVTADAGGNTAFDGSVDAPVMGAFFGSGFVTSDVTKLDGLPAAGAATTIAYPLDGALFPANFGPITVQVTKTSSSQTLARLRWSGDGVDVRYYAVCEAGPGSATGCFVTIPLWFTSPLVAASQHTDIALDARLAAANGDALSASRPIKMFWASAALSGGIYYWTTIPGKAKGTTGIARYDFGNAANRQVVYVGDASTPPNHSNPNHCVGCHAITPDGSKLALTLGGSTASDFMLLDVATKAVIGLRNAGPGGFATFTTFAPDGAHMINSYRGDLYLREVSAALTDVATVLTSVGTEKKTDPFWSADGTLFAFTSWVPGENGALPAADPEALNGDTREGGQIWVASSDGVSVQDSARLIVPRAPGVTSYYPALSDDSSLMVFNQSSCSGPPTPGTTGISPCDGYDDLSARLFLVPPTGGAPLALDNANGSGAISNSWPRFSPDHGTFRGQRLYWIAFSSRRPYGLQVNTGTTVADPGKPQLWFTAVAITDGGFPTRDPSFPPIWLPDQNPDQTNPNGNHVPQWVRKVVAIIP